MFLLQLLCLLLMLLLDRLFLSLIRLLLVELCAFLLLLLLNLLPLLILLCVQLILFLLVLFVQPSIGRGLSSRPRWSRSLIRVDRRSGRIPVGLRRSRRTIRIGRTVCRAVRRRSSVGSHRVVWWLIRVVRWRRPVSRTVRGSRIVRRCLWSFIWGRKSGGFRRFGGVVR